MRILKSIGKCLFWTLMVVLLLVPVGLIFQLSQAEMAEYEPEPVPVILDSAYGTIHAAYRGDIAEYTQVSGTFVCDEYAYMELDYRYVDRIRWEVAESDLIREGQVLGDYQGEDVVSTITGILTAIQTYGTEPYLQVQLLEPVELECNVTDTVLKTLERDAEKLTDADGNPVSLSFVSPLKNEDGTTTIRLSLDGTTGICGQKVQSLPVYTGRVYTGVLMLDADCVYQKQEGQDQPWFVRQVSADGVFLNEQEVQLGYTDGQVICVTGVEEGDCFDGGYKFILEGERT